MGAHACIFLEEIPFTAFFQFCQETVKDVDIFCKGNTGLIGQGQYLFLIRDVQVFVLGKDFQFLEEVDSMLNNLAAILGKLLIQDR